MTASRLLFSIIIACSVAGCADQGSQSKESAIEQLMSAYSGDVPGASVLVIEGDTIAYSRSFGLADVENQTPTTPATNYRLASISKQFTATAIMMLVEREILTYETNLSQIFEGFPEYGSEITVSHLLSHTSGLIAYEELLPDTLTTQLKDADVLEMMMSQSGTYFEPGTEYRYSNSAYALLAMAVERYSNQSFATFLENNIFTPVGMDATIAFENGISSVESRAFGHVYDEESGKFIRRDQSRTSAILGDGGVYSSIEDLSKWDKVLYTDDLLPRTVFENAWTPKPNTTHDDGEQYGYGWYVDTYAGEKNLRHSGSTSGFRNDLERFPNRGLTVIVLTNRNAPPVKALTRQIADLYLGDS